MKRYLYATSAGILVFLAARMTVSLTSDPKTGSGSADTAPHAESPGAREDSKSAEEPLIQNEDDKLVARSEAPVDLESLGVDASLFKDITSDPALIRILATYRPPSVGTLEVSGAGKVVLQLADGRRFAAAQIGMTRSESSDGTVAIEAITAEGGQQLREVDKEKDGVTTTGNPQEIWVLTSKGRTEKVSPANVHAEHPIISPDGRYVAFTARNVVEGRLRSKVLLIKDRVNGQLTSYADRKRGADYEIKPVDWVEEGSVLRVIEDWGETGGHLNLKEVRVR